MANQAGWQVNKTVIECNRYMLRNRICADVILEVNQPDAKTTHFYGHRYVLASRSPVFHALFNKEKLHKKEDIAITKITDVKPEAFEALLKYMYCEEVAVDQYNVFGVLRAAKKFNVPSLVTICYDFLEEHLSVSKACDFLERAATYSGDPFIMQCMYYIWNHAEKVLQSKGFSQLSQPMLKAVVSSNYMAVPETHIYRACMRWAEARCAEASTQPTTEVLRHCLGDVIYAIRFPLMEPTEFANLVGRSELLTNEDKSDIYTQMLASSGARERQSRFLRTPRTPKSVLNRFSMSMKRPKSEISDDAITFSTDHDILMCGVGIYGSQTPGRIHVHLQLLAKGVDPMSLATDLTVECDGRPEPYELSLPVPVYMTKQQPYTVLVNITGATNYCGFHGVGNVSCGGVAFTFSKSELSGNDTVVEMGQIPQLIFYKSPS